MPHDLVLTTAYFPAIAWWQVACRQQRIVLNHEERYEKQTTRNRCVIAAANGLQTLTVPVERGATMGRDVRISNHTNWRRVHWQALQSAYGTSPFFDYYADDLQPFFTKRWTFLYDFNQEIIATVNNLLDYDAPLATALNAMSTAVPIAAADNMLGAAPSEKPTAAPVLRPYYQVYQRRHGFLPNLSILDLLFNMGNEAVLYL